MLKHPLKQWLSLRPGDTVALIAPASKAPDDCLIQARALLTQWGLNAAISPTLFGTHPLSCDFANTDFARFTDLQHALTDPTIKAIWCLRGGYGSIRLIPYLDQLPEPPLVKLFIGFSDITLLHVYFQQHWGWCTVHGPAVTQIVAPSAQPLDALALRALLLGERPIFSIENLTALNACARKSQTLPTCIAGGNLTLLSRTLGTPFALNAQGKILLLEEVNEPFRKVDGMLMQLHLAGYFHGPQKPCAILLGDFIAPTQQPDEQQAILRCLHEWAKVWEEASIPVITCREIGHGQGNYPVPLGSNATLVLGETISLEIKVKRL